MKLDENQGFVASPSCGPYPRPWFEGMLRLLAFVLLVELNARNATNTSTPAGSHLAEHRDEDKKKTAKATLELTDAVLFGYEKAPEGKRPTEKDLNVNPPLQRLDSRRPGKRPNFVVIFLDDSGFSDLGIACNSGFGASVCSLAPRLCPRGP